MRKIIIIIAILFCGFASKAQSVSDNASQDVSLGLTDALDVTFVGTGSTTGSSVNLAFTTVNNYKNGVTSGAQQIKVRSNKSFIVKVKADAAYFTYSGPESPAPTMPVTGVLKLKVTANTTGGSIVSPYKSFGNIQSTGRSLISNGSAGGNQAFSVQYKATPGFSYPGGSYTINIVYTATQS